MATQNNNNSSQRVTNKQLLDAVQGLTTEIQVMKTQLDNEIKKNDKLIDDHEVRLRSLEKLVWTSSWISSLISTGVTAVVVAFLTGRI